MKFTRKQIVEMLSLEGEAQRELLERAAAIRSEVVGDAVRLRGLIEYSNRCRKNCLYCGIRRGMKGITRYTLTQKEVMDAARYALCEGYGSVVIQAGEITPGKHIITIEKLVSRIKNLKPGDVGLAPAEYAEWDESLGITLSLGEQSYDTYRRWFEAGATRYLLRIESSDPAFFSTIHPSDSRHLYNDRLRAIEDLRRAGFQVGTGVMIGLPGQRLENLADDLLFMQHMDIDMCGMGPYVECEGTPLAGLPVPPKEWRVETTLKMIAILRLMMPRINIAAATALETLDAQGRRRALAAGANVVMPNITPMAARSEYRLYDNKPSGIDLQSAGLDFLRGKSGDSLHFENKLKNPRK